LTSLAFKQTKQELSTIVKKNLLH